MSPSLLISKTKTDGHITSANNSRFCSGHKRLSSDRRLLAAADIHKMLVYVSSDAGAVRIMERNQGRPSCPGCAKVPECEFTRWQLRPTFALQPEVILAIRHPALRSRMQRLAGWQPEQLHDHRQQGLPHAPRPWHARRQRQRERADNLQGWR